MRALSRLLLVLVPLAVSTACGGGWPYYDDGYCYEECFTVCGPLGCHEVCDVYCDDPYYYATSGSEHAATSGDAPEWVPGADVY